MAEVLRNPCTVAAEGGLVYVDGPGNIAFTMTPAAAAQSAERLRARAVEAERQAPSAGEQA